MKKHLVSFLMIQLMGFAAAGSSIDSAGRGPKEGYSGKEAGKVSSEVPEELKGVTIEEKLGQNIDLNLMVTTENGEKKPLSSFLRPHRPLILSPVYFNCPGLCSFHLNGLVDGLKGVDWTAGDKFDVMAFSFDSKENGVADLGHKKKENYLKVYGREGSEKGWHFVTADEPTVQKLMSQVGFQFRWNERANEWSHASAAIIISDKGVISRYLHGIQFEPRDVKLALNEASNGKVGNIIDSVMMYCFKYDSHQSRYGLQVFRVMQLAGALTVLLLALWLLPVLIRAKREKS